MLASLFYLVRRRLLSLVAPNRRSHRGLELEVPERLAPVDEADRVPDIERRDLLGGLVHEYRRAA